MWKEEKAQTSMEYLLVLGGAVATATVVGLYLKSMPKTTGAQMEKAAQNP